MDWTTLVVNLPLVAAFIWYSSQQTKTFLDALALRDKEYEMRNQAVCNALAGVTNQLAALTSILTSHDAKVDTRLGELSGTVDAAVSIVANGKSKTQ